MTETAEAWIAPERQVWDAYIARLGELREDPRAATILDAIKLGHLAAGPLDGTRVSDLAMAIHQLESALEPERAPMPDIRFMEPDDIVRHPGFDGVEDEVVAEERFRLHLRTVAADA